MDSNCKPLKELLTKLPLYQRTILPREGVIMDHNLIVIMPLGRFYDPAFPCILLRLSIKKIM